MIYKILFRIINFLLGVNILLTNNYRWTLQLLKLNNYLVKKRFRKHLSKEKYQQYLKSMEKK